MELEQVGRAMDSIPGFPAELKTLVRHLLISHHGQYEFGSPKLPMTREALALSFLDDLDSKMGAARAALASESGDEMWSGYVQALGRRFLRVDAYRKGEQESAATQGQGEGVQGAKAAAADQQED
jgi:3'-5' exoribonuclease